jgi:DNA uptake protein ComE-like DNA-binding protein
LTSNHEHLHIVAPVLKFLEGETVKALVAAFLAAVLSLVAPAFAAQGDPVLVAQAKTELIDINHAKAEELMKLKGIGEARAAAIIKGRPYARKDELVQKKIVPESVYNDIKDKIIAKQ